MSRRTILVVAALGGVLLALGIVLLRPAPGSRVAVPKLAAPVAVPSSVAAPSPTPAVSPTTPADADVVQATGTARQFLVVYASSATGAGDLRARLRPYDTDRLDALLGQGADAPATGSASASVQQLTVVGPAPDGRLVMTAQLTIAGAGQTARSQWIELYLASTPAGWRVDEVAL